MKYKGLKIPHTSADCESWKSVEETREKASNISPSFSDNNHAVNHVQRRYCNITTDTTQLRDTPLSSTVSPRALLTNEDFQELLILRRFWSAIARFFGGVPPGAALSDTHRPRWVVPLPLLDKSGRRCWHGAVWWWFCCCLARGCSLAAGYYSNVPLSSCIIGSW